MNEKKDDCGQCGCEEKEVMIDGKKYFEVTLDLTDKMILEIALMAHEKNMTFNDFVIEILQNYIKKHEEKTEDN